MNKRQQGHSQVTSAAKADISERSGRRIEKGERKSIPTEHKMSLIDVEQAPNQDML